MIEIKISHEGFILDHRKAAYHVSTQSLILADLHIGKSSHFRKSGYSLPGYSFSRDLDRLLVLNETYRPRQIVFLGDLYHSDFNEEFIHWHHSIKARINCKMTLVVGNHDEITVSRNELLREFQVLDELLMGPLRLTHHPIESSEFNLCGHIHPGVKLRGSGMQSVKVSCFWLQSNRLVFPAFGELTGLGLIKPEEGDGIYACISNTVLDISNNL